MTDLNRLKILIVKHAKQLKENITKQIKVIHNKVTSWIGTIKTPKVNLSTSLDQLTKSLKYAIRLTSIQYKKHIRIAKKKSILLVNRITEQNVTKSTTNKIKKLAQSFAQRPDKIHISAFVAILIFILVSLSSIANEKPNLSPMQPQQSLAQTSTIASQIAETKTIQNFQTNRRATLKTDAFMTGIYPEPIDVEAVLVPRRTTVISSSRNGRISEIPLHNGDIFKKGDTLLRYDCRDLEAEIQITKQERELTDKRLSGSYKLFNLDLISKLDKDIVTTENVKAKAKEEAVKAQLDTCVIKADFNGRVTNRLANPGEFTRTDRVLLEVASNDTLQAEFLIPSKWLRWVNVGAPIAITISETGKNYAAEIIRIYGEVDPVSQSIQMVAKLKPYEDRLLPGMSGAATIDIKSIQESGVKGFLEAGLQQKQKNRL